MILLQLLISFFQIGLFSFGGGYASLPLIQEQVVDIHAWLTIKEFTDLVTISQTVSYTHLSHCGSTYRFL